MSDDRPSEDAAPSEDAGQPGATDARTPAPDAELDARGLLCPLPVLKTRKRLEPLAPGAVLRVVADDRSPDWRPAPSSQ